jgi:serine/threonine-protein kinase
MFWAVRAAAPRSLLTSASEGGGATAGWPGVLGVPGAPAGGAAGALGVLGAVAGAAGTAEAVEAVGAVGAAGALALADGDAAFSFSAGTPSGMAGCDPVPFPRVGR